MSSMLGGSLMAQGLGRTILTGTGVALGTSIIAGGAALTGLKALQGNENTSAKVARTFLQVVAFGSGCTITAIASLSTALAVHVISDNIELSLTAGAVTCVSSIYLTQQKIYERN